MDLIKMNKVKKAQPLTPFWGGLLLNSCAPLEISLNWCTHNCAYCFANLNDPDRASDVQSAIRSIKQRHERDTYEAFLLREGYPVVLSNKVDPFAVSNEDAALELIKVMSEEGIPFTLQTKGGRKIDEALAIIGDKPIVWYISLATLDEDVLKKVEPGAPSAAQRLLLIEKIINRGHKVCVGINPVVPEWISIPSALTDKLSDLGVSGVWVQPMHLSKNQLGRMPERGQTALGEKVVADARKSRTKLSPDVIEALKQTREAAIASGLEVYDSGQHQRSDYFKPYEELYPKRFPLMQEFTNHCHDTKQAGDWIYFAEFLDFFGDRLPLGEWRLREHLAAIVFRAALNGLFIPQRMDYETLLCYIWEHKQTGISPVNCGAFAWAAEWEKQENGKHGWTQLVDDLNLPILVFQPEGTDSAFIDVKPTSQTL